MAVYGIGLPRCGGQSLAKALEILLGSCIHSPGKARAITASAVEVFRDPQCILREDPDAKFILNARDEGAWLDSCRRVLHLSREWNHPLWKYPIRDFPEYRRAYLDARLKMDSPLLVHDFTLAPKWEPLCEFLGVPIPSEPFPSVDRIAQGVVGVVKG